MIAIGVRDRSIYSGSPKPAPFEPILGVQPARTLGERLARVLDHPDAQAFTARLAGAGSMRDELAALFERVPATATPEHYRRAILDDNATGKRSQTARMWAWKRLKLRYALDSTDTVEFGAFRSAYDATSSATDRGLLVGVMLARTDRLFREVTLTLVSPHLQGGGVRLDQNDVLNVVDDCRRDANTTWSSESLRSITAHLISSWRDAAFLTIGKEQRTLRVDPGPVVTRFAAELAKAEGSTDRAVPRSVWFRLLGADEAAAIELLRDSAAAGALTFRFQADVLELGFAARARA